MSAKAPLEEQIQNGDRCIVVAGAHKGKTGVVKDRNLSKGGNVTITVLQENGDRFKTLARNVSVSS